MAQPIQLAANSTRISSKKDATSCLKIKPTKEIFCGILTWEQMPPSVCSRNPLVSPMVKEYGEMTGSRGMR
jgi:hypothetical protein